MWEKIILFTFINNRTPIINVFFALTRVGLKIPNHHYILNWFQICEGGGHWGLRYCGNGQFFMRYFGNFNFKLRYCGVLRICGMRYFWRFGQRYLIKKKLFYTVSDPLTFVRDSCRSQAIRKSMPSKLSSYRDHNGNGNGNAFI